MTSIGIVGLDTSHAEAFAANLDERDGVDVTAVWDGGTVRGDRYVRDFCEQFEATRYEEPTDMVDAVDGAMVLTVDWESHCDLALPFLEHDVPTLVDKPIAGRLRDIERLEAAGSAPRLFGGSAVPYHPAIDSLEEVESNPTVYCVGYDDPFYYGGHLVDVVRRIAGADWVSVEPSGQPGLSVDVVFQNDTFATIRFDGSDTDDFTFLTVGNETSSTVVGSSSTERRAMYDAYLDAYLSVFEGANGGQRVVDGAKLLLAIHSSLTARRAITPESDTLREFSIDDDAFVENYEPYY